MCRRGRQPGVGPFGIHRSAFEKSVAVGTGYLRKLALCISRTAAESIQTDRFFKSPKGEHAWMHRYDQDNWVFPEWPIDLRAEADTLKKLGYRMFVSLNEPLPKGVQMKKRPGKWNWDVGLK